MNSQPTPIDRQKAFVVSGHLGTTGGGALAPLLLCQELTNLGLEVTAFAKTLLFGNGALPDAFHIVTPWISRGCRWDLPERVLARQVLLETSKESPDFVIMCGVTRLARCLLTSKIAGQLIVWEFSNATSGNKMVDNQASNLLNKCRFMISPSTTIDQCIRNTYKFERKILRLPFWVIDHGLTWIKAPSTFENDFIYLGRRDLEKGLEELVTAAAIVARSFENVRVLIAGPGNAKPYRKLALDLGIAANISFEFFQSHAETLKALSRSRCLVLPSYHEGYPLVLLEAAEGGVPFIATRVGSIPEVYEGAGCGLIIPPRDKNALAGAMLQILREQEEEYTARRHAARSAFERLSSTQAVRANMIKFLEAISGS